MTFHLYLRENGREGSSRLAGPSPQWFAVLRKKILIMMRIKLASFVVQGSHTGQQDFCKVTGR